jgi:subtilisin-like proprotein convertase family protein
MRKISLFLIPLFFCVGITNAQIPNTDNAAAMQLVAQSKATLGFSQEQLRNLTVLNAYYDKVSGLNMVYLQQTYKGIPVYNQIIKLAFKNGQLLTNAGEFNHSIEKFIKVNSVLPLISAEAAVISAMANRKLVSTKPTIALKHNENSQKIEFGDLGVSKENITAQLMWYPSTNKYAVNLAWQICMIPTSSSDYWLVRIDANTNSFLGADNLMNSNVASCPIVTVSYAGPAVAIPDNVVAGIDIPITVSGVGIIGDLDFKFDAATASTCDATIGNTSAAVDHSFVGDLTFKLTSPTGTVRTFMARRAGTRENICNTLIDDDGSFPNVSTLTSVTGSTVSGNFSPETTGSLSAFDGQNANGVWILNVSDNAAIEVGSIRRFSLIFNTECPCVLTCPANITVNNTPGICGAIINYTAPTTTGSCGTVTSVPASGSTFPIGTTTVTATSSTTAATCSFTVTVVDNQPPVITCPANITRCGSQAVTFAAATATDNCSAIVTQIAGPASGTIFPVGTTVITYRAVDPAGNTVACSFNVIINPVPNAVATPASQTICSANPITDIALTGAVTGTTFSCTRNNTVTVTGIAANGSGNITGTLTNITNAPITVTFTITPTASGCPGPVITATVLVNPTPDVLAGGTGNLFIPGTLALADPTYNRPLSYVQGGVCALSGVGTAVHYKTHSFTLATPSNVTVSLVPANGAAITPSAADTYLQLIGPGGFTPTATCTNSIAGNDDAVGALSRIVTTTPLAAGTYTVVVSFFSNTPTGAGALPWTYTLAVLLPPAIVLPSQVVCNNTVTAPVVFASSVTGTTFGWTNNTASIGLAASGTGNIPTFTATNTGTTPVVGTVTVTPTANGCPGPAKTFTITVNPTPTVNSISNQAVCNGLPTTAVTFGSAVSGATYAWTNNTTSIGLAASGISNIPSFNAVNLGTTPVVATISVIATANGCAGPVQTFTITVNPTPMVTLAAFAPICRNASALTLTGGSPTTGGTGLYFVDGIAQTAITPANYTPGLHTIVYQFTTTAGCVNSATRTILVHPTHVIVITVAPNTGVRPGLNATVIATVSPVDNYTYQWVKNSNINLSATGDRVDVLANDAGNYKVTVTAPTGCVVESENAFTASAISNQLYVFPNPNTGLFNVSYNDGGANLLGRTLSVYDARGSKVFAQTYTVNVPLGNMVVDIRNKARGKYYAVLRDSNGKRLATATVEKL